MSRENLEYLKKKFKAAASTEDAAQMKKYMRGKFEYFGVKTPMREQIQKEFLKERSLPEKDELLAFVEMLWKEPQRELQYVAMLFLDKCIKNLDKQDIAVAEMMIREKSWWDTVDLIASKIVGTHFQRFPEMIDEYTAKWMASGNIWLQRTCLLYQLKYKKELDTKRLESFIEPLTTSDEFFIQKAIGWILREYSKSNMDYVVDYVRNHKLAQLSHREALKWLINKGKLPQE